MIIREKTKRHVAKTVDMAAAVATQDPERLNEPDFVEVITQSIYGECEDPSEAGAAIAHHAIQTAAQRDQLLSTVKAYKAQLSEQLRLAWFLGGRFSFGNNGTTRQMVWVQPMGHPGSSPVPVCLTDEEMPLPDPLSPVYVDGACKFLLRPADEVPLSSRESPVVRVEEDARFDLSEVVIQAGPEFRPRLWSTKTLAKSIVERQGRGEKVTIQHDDSTAFSVVESKAATEESWLVFPDADGPQFDELVFPRQFKKFLRKIIRRMQKGRPLMLACMGPTGVGKSETPLRAAREASKGNGRPIALIRFSLGRMGSSYWSQTEQNIVAIKERAIQLAMEGYMVVILVDEADSLLGNSEGRFESSTNRSVRNTFQSEFSQPLGEYVSVWLNSNIRKDSWFPAPILRRAIKMIFPAMARGQCARIGATYADPEAMALLNTSCEDFGKQLADYLFAVSFCVARVTMHSGDTFYVRASQLRDMSPGRVESIVVDFNDDVLDGEITSIHELWPMLEREFRSTPLTEANLYELTHLDPPANDTVRKVELLKDGGSQPKVQFAKTR